MATCKCGRKATVIQRKLITSGKYNGWIETIMNCDICGRFKQRIRPALKGEES